MELIDDRKRLLRLAIVFQLDLEDFIFNLKRSQPAADDTARSEFIQGVVHFLKHAVVTPLTVPATEPPVVNPSTRISCSAPAAILGSEPATEPAVVPAVVDALSQSMATTHLPDEVDDVPSDSDTDVSSGSYSAASTITHASAISATGNSTHGNARKVIADAARSKSSGSGPPVTSNKRGRECNEDDEEEVEGGPENWDEAGEDGSETEVDEKEDWDDKGKKAEGKKVGAGGRKHRKMAHHNCKIPCGESMRIDE